MQSTQWTFKSIFHSRVIVQPLPDILNQYHLYRYKAKSPCSLMRLKLKLSCVVVVVSEAGSHCVSQAGLGTPL